MSELNFQHLLNPDLIPNTYKTWRGHCPIYPPRGNKNPLMISPKNYMQHAIVIVIDITPPPSWGQKRSLRKVKQKYLRKKNHRGIRNKKINFLTKFYGGFSLKIFRVKVKKWVNGVQKMLLGGGQTKLLRFVLQVYPQQEVRKSQEVSGRR